MITLMYHDVVVRGAEDSSGFPGGDAASYKLTPDQFEAHLDAIVRRSGMAPPVMTFDDGGAGALPAADALERRQLRGSFFITTNYIATPGFLSGAALRDLHARGHVIGSHSCSHPLRMARLPLPRMLDEWRASRAALSDALGSDVRTASVPGGDLSRAVAEAAADAGYTTLFTSEPTDTIWTVGDLSVCGRYTIQRWTSPATAAALAAGACVPVWRQAALWRVKRFAKQIGGQRYLDLRQLVLGHDDEIRWGDRV